MIVNLHNSVIQIAFTVDTSNENNYEYRNSCSHLTDNFHLLSCILIILFWERVDCRVEERGLNVSTERAVLCKRDDSKGTIRVSIIDLPRLGSGLDLELGLGLGLGLGRV